MVRGRKGYEGAIQGTGKKPLETKESVSEGKWEGGTELSYVKCNIQILKRWGLRLQELVTFPRTL